MPEGLYDLHQVVGWLRAERALDVRALSVRGLLGGTIGECLIFATAVSRAHMTRVARTVQVEFKNAGVVRYGQSPAIEGKQSDEWLLIDGGDCVVSVMVDEARANLQLEEHWQAQGATELDLPPDELASLEPRLTTAAAMAAFGDGGERCERRRSKAASALGRRVRRGWEHGSIPQPPPGGADAAFACRARCHRSGSLRLRLCQCTVTVGITTLDKHVTGKQVSPPASTRPSPTHGEFRRTRWCVRVLGMGRSGNPKQSFPTKGVNCGPTGCE